MSVCRVYMCAQSCAACVEFRGGHYVSSFLARHLFQAESLAEPEVCTLGVSSHLMASSGLQGHSLMWVYTYLDTCTYPVYVNKYKS